MDVIHRRTRISCLEMATFGRSQFNKKRNAIRYGSSLRVKDGELAVLYQQRRFNARFYCWSL